MSLTDVVRKGGRIRGKAVLGKLKLGARVLAPMSFIIINDTDVVSEGLYISRCVLASCDQHKREG